MPPTLTLQEARKKQNSQLEELWRLQRVHATAPVHERDKIQSQMDQLGTEIRELDDIISGLINAESKS